MIMTAIYVPLLIPIIFSKHILMATGQDERVAAYAFDYMMPMIPAMYFLGHFDLFRRFLICIQHSRVPMVA